MEDILLKFVFTDRAGRGVYDVWSMQTECPECQMKDFAPTRQKIRFDLDQNLHIKVDTVVMLGEPDESETEDG